MRSAPEAITSRFARFAVTGLFCTLLYGVLTAWLVSGMGVPPVWGTIIGYASIVPLNFVLQRSFSFRSRNAPQGDLVRFACVHGGNIVGSAAIMRGLVALDLDYRIGVVLTMTLVPVAIFLLLDKWVFAHRRPRHKTNSSGNNDD